MLGDTVTADPHPEPQSLDAMPALGSCRKEGAPLTVLTVASCVLGLAGRAQHTAKG